MREIKFRGLTGTTKGNKWVYGYLYKVKSFFNEDYNWYIRDGYLQDFIVEENSIGQYVGLKDKNGVEIYENDVVKYKFGKFGQEIQAPVKFGAYRHSKCDEYDCEHYGWYIEYEWSNYKNNTGIDLYEEIKEIEVIGNIYEVD